MMIMRNSILYIVLIYAHVNIVFCYKNSIEFGVYKLANLNQYKIVNLSAQQEGVQNLDSLDLQTKVTYEKNVSGWNYLTINSSFPSSIDHQLSIYFSSGIAEGYVTCNEIRLSYPNFYADNFGMIEIFK